MQATDPEHRFRPQPFQANLLMLLLAGLPILSSAQLGVSPSQNAAFLQELRSRSPQLKASAGDVLAEDRRHLEAGRALSRPDYFSTSTAGARRLVMDVSTYASQYQTGRTYLSPWYDGWHSPATAGEGEFAPRGLGLEQRFEYNTQVFPETKDWISSTYWLADQQWRLAENHHLSLSAGLGVNFLPDSSEWEQDPLGRDLGLNILPGSSLTYDTDLGPVHLSIYGTSAMRTNQVTPVWQNSFGTALTWQILDNLSWTLNSTLSRSRYRDAWMNPRIPAIDQESDQTTISSQVIWQLSPVYALGLEAAYTEHEPTKSVRPNRNDATAWNLGVFTDIRLAQHTRLRLAGGWQELEFRGRGLRTAGPPGLMFLANHPEQNSSLPYYNLVLSSRLNDRLSHELAAGYESNLDFIANSNESTYLNYGLTARLWKGGQASLSGFVEQVEARRGRGDYSFLFAAANEFLRHGLDLHVAQQLTNHWSVAVGAHWNRNELRERSLYEFPRQPSFDVFEQQAVGVNTSYTLNARTTLQLAWQLFVNDSLPSRMSDDTQSRISLSVRLLF